MKPNLLLKKIKKNNVVRKKLYNDKKYRNVVGFLAAKGYLKTDKIKLKPLVKLDIDDVLWVGENIEPRVIEVLPAALIHFPKTFLNTNNVPKDLMDIITLIIKNQNADINYKGIEYQKMKFWANFIPKDRRVQSIGERKRLKTFRLKPDVIQKLKNESIKNKLSETEYLENLIQNA